MFQRQFLAISKNSLPSIGVTSCSSFSRILESSPMTVESVRNYPGNLKEIRIRIGAVKNIKKITATMKLVAASKLNKATRTMEEMRPFKVATQTLLNEEFPPLPIDAEGKEVDLEPEVIDSLGKGKHLIIAMTSDRGLCGGVNSSVVRITKKLVSYNPQNTTLAMIGDKALSGLMNECSSSFKFSVSGVSGNTKTSFTEIAQIADTISLFDWDNLTIVHNNFVSVLTFRTARRMLPSKAVFADKKRFPTFEFEGDREEVMNDYFTIV